MTRGSSGLSGPEHRRPDFRDREGCHRPVRATQICYEVPTYKDFESPNILHVGLMFVLLDDMAAREASNLSARMTRVDQVEPGPPDLNHKHVRNLQPSISLVRSNG